MKKTFFKTLMATTILSLAVSFSAFAEWKHDENGTWWQNEDGTWPAGEWVWIDGNNDGTSECFYFNEDGYCLKETVTPDGYTVDESGCWVVDGVVQTQVVKKEEATAETGRLSFSYALYYNGTSGYSSQHYYSEDGKDSLWLNKKDKTDSFVFGTTMFKSDSDNSNLFTTEDFYPLQQQAWFSGDETILYIKNLSTGKVFEYYLEGNIDRHYR